MIHSEMLRKLKVGEVLETLPMFEAVTDEPVCFKVERTDACDPERMNVASTFIVEFSIWYHEIPIGTWAVKVEGENLEWIDVDQAKYGRILH
jgi:hypothetical protein